MPHSWYRALLACPSCHGSLEESETHFHCSRCNDSFAISATEPLSFFPASLRTHLEGNSGDPSWTRWREAMAGLDRWRSQRKHAVVSRSDGVTEPETIALIERASLHGVLLDVGCKDGARRKLLEKDAKYIGIDPRPLGPAAPDAHTVLFAGVGEALPLANESVDGILCFAAFDYFVDGAKALEEFSRVLRPEKSLALLVSVVPEVIAAARNADTRIERLRGAWHVTRRWSIAAGFTVAREALASPERAHTHYYTRSGVLALLRQRFRVCHVQEVTRAASSILYVHAQKL